MFATLRIILWQHKERLRQLNWLGSGRRKMARRLLIENSGIITVIITRILMSQLLIISVARLTPRLAASSNLNELSENFMNFERVKLKTF